VLIVVDNVEALLADEGNVGAVFGVLAKLLPLSHLLFTTREALPAPFNHTAREIVLGALSVTDAKALVMQVMNNEGLHLRHDDQGKSPQEVDDLVGSVGCHARALVLLARELAQRGVKATTANARAIMQELEQRHPGQRELSLFASVELSLRRLSPDVREQIAGLAVFQDGGGLNLMMPVLGVDEEQIRNIRTELVQVGLGQMIGEYGYFRLDPALPTYLEFSLTQEQRQHYQQYWLEVIGELINWLYQQHFQDAKLSAQLTQLELPNLMSYFYKLTQLMETDQNLVEILVEKTRSIEQLLANLNHPQALAEVVKIRQWASQYLTGWSSVRFEHERMKIERLWQNGALQQALDASQSLLKHCQQIDERNALRTSNLAMANVLVGITLKRLQNFKDALSHLKSAESFFKLSGDIAAIPATLVDQGDCYRNLGQLDFSEKAYKESADLADKFGNNRQVSVAKAQLATVFMERGNYNEALSTYKNAFTIFEQLGDLREMAVTMRQIGIIYLKNNKLLDSENYFREALRISTQIKAIDVEAYTLDTLSLLYEKWKKIDEAINCAKNSARIYRKLENPILELKIRNRLVNMLFDLKYYNEVNTELLLITECSNFTDSVPVWDIWERLYNIERIAGNTTNSNFYWQQAVQTYLLYRHNGGESQQGGFHLCNDVLQSIKNNNLYRKNLEAVIIELLKREDWQENKEFLHKLQAILSGDRDIILGKKAILRFDLEVELLVLLEELKQAGI